MIEQGKEIGDNYPHVWDEMKRLDKSNVHLSEYAMRSIDRRVKIRESDSQDHSFFRRFKKILGLNI